MRHYQCCLGNGGYWDSGGMCDANGVWYWRPSHVCCRHSNGVNTWKNSKTNRPATSKEAELQSPRVVEKYNKCLEELINKHCLIEKVGKAFHAAMEEEMTTLLNKADDECTQCMKHVEHKCRKFRTG